MKTIRWTTTTMLLALCAAPAAAQMRGTTDDGAMPHPGMHRRLMAPCVEGGAMMGPGMTRQGTMEQETTRGAMRWMGPIGLEGAGTDPVALLGAAEALELSPAQRDRLDAIAGTERQDRQEQLGVAQEAYRRAADALQGGPADLRAYEQALQEAADAMVQAQVATARARSEAGEVLTPEQRKKLHESLALVDSMMCGEGDASTGAGPGPGGHR